jgi:hypothetical protein
MLPLVLNERLAFLARRNVILVKGVEPLQEQRREPVLNVREQGKFNMQHRLDLDNSSRLARVTYVTVKVP